MISLEKLIKLLFIKFTFKSPPKAEVLIFDNISSEEFKYALKDLKYYTLNVRFEEIKIIYISWQILFSFFKNIFTGLKISYLIALIKTVAPKIIITLEDNSFDFSKIAKILNRRYIFIAVQNSVRHFGQYRKLFEKKILNTNTNNLLFLPNYFCFGDHEVTDTKKENVVVKNYFPSGLLRLSNYIQFKKDNNIDVGKVKYDLALICENLESKTKLWKSEKFAQDIIKLFTYSIRAAINNKLKIKFILKSKKNKKNEINFYKKYLNIKEIKFFLENIIEQDRESYQSYIAIENSKVVAAFHSTMLIEKLALNGKILACNFTDEEIFNFPVDCFFRLIRPSYEEFENRLLKILEFQDENYLKKIKKKLVASHEELTHKIINTKIKKFLNDP